MSHDATNWAIKQRGIKPALKVVLWNLCDRYHPDNGCFPSQETLAHDCEVPRSTLNTYLDQLEAMGLILREQRRKVGTQRQERTRYFFPFEPDFAEKIAEKPSPETGHGSGASVSRNQGEPSPENGESRVQNLDSNLVREPVREPVKEREGASANSENPEDDQHKLARRVKALELGRHNNPWPGVIGSSTQWATTQFSKLSPEDRRLAEGRRDAYLDLCRAQRVKPVALGVYFRDRKFEDVVAANEAAVVAPVTRDGKIMAPVFGPVWAAARMMTLLSGPARVMLPGDFRETVFQTYQAHLSRSPSRAAGYVQRMGITIAADGGLIFPQDFEKREAERRTVSEGYPEANRLNSAARDQRNASVPAMMEALKDLCEYVPVGSQVWDSWFALHERNGWPFVPQPAGMKGVYFPKGGPEGLGEFERAARSLLEARGNDDAA